jgi:hypothetical protein
MVTIPQPNDRINDSRKKRHDAHDSSIAPPDATHPNNNEVADYAIFTKGLEHNEKGEVVPAAFNQFLKAIEDSLKDGPRYSNAVGYFMGINTPNGSKKRERWVNPVSGLAYDSEGVDSFNQVIPPAPRIDSLEGGAEIAELYWMSLLRDINFTDYDEPDEAPEVQEAINDLNSDRFKNYKFNNIGWTRDDKPVSPKTLFRGTNIGDDVGPYISQFMLRGNDDYTLDNSEEDGYVKYGVATINQRHVVAISELDFMTDTRSWLDVQNGFDPENRRDRLVDPKHTLFQKTPRFIRNLRDLATYVHFDALYQAYLTACIYMLNAKDKDGNGLFKVNSSFPYNVASKQHGFGTYGEPHILSLVCEVATRALKAVWFQKWFVHRRLRPEAFAGLIHHHKIQAKSYPIHESILNSPVLDKIFRKNEKLNKEYNRKNLDNKIEGTYLLPQAFVEGSPLHPSYGAGHATVAGACVTILKAWFENLKPIPGKIVEANGSGRGLKEYKGNDTNKMTVHGELNKLAANVAIGRNGGGVHYRSDYTSSLVLGEKVAISILKELKEYYLPEKVDFKFIPFFKDSIEPI